MKTRPVFLLSLVAAGAAGCMGTPPEPGRDARGANGAVTSDHPLASAQGLRVLREGGNAMDAAITMAGVLSVARPHMNGLGGDMFLLYYEASSGKTYALNASGPAGKLASIAAAKGTDAQRTEMPQTGPMSVSVPGAVRGWSVALERFGTISWAAALKPAVDLAREGLPVSERLAADIAEEREKLEADPEAAKVYLPEGAPPKPGTLLKQDDLAATLAVLRERGAEELYGGESAKKIGDYVQQRGGFLTRDDLIGFGPEWVEPLTADYRDMTVAAFPPNTQGVMLLETLRLLSGFDISTLGHNTADYLHTLTEALRMAVADRDSAVADPVAMRVSVAQLLDSARLAALAGTIDPKARAHGVPGTASTDHPNTVYIIAVDSRGNIVSMIQSLYAAFGSGLVVPGTGIVLHNRGALFSLDPKHPNALTPGRRPFHTLCPALVFRGGKPWLAFGTPGGDGQVHTLVQVLNNIALFDMTPQQAIDAPRLRRLPDGRLAIEDRVDETVRQALTDRGYVVLPRAGWTAEFGGAQAVLIDPRSGERRAGADRRREAWAGAY